MSRAKKLHTRGECCHVFDSQVLLQRVATRRNFVLRWRELDLSEHYACVCREQRTRKRHIAVHIQALPHAVVRVAHVVVHKVERIRKRVLERDGFCNLPRDLENVVGRWSANTKNLHHHRDHSHSNFLCDHAVLYTGHDENGFTHLTRRLPSHCTRPQQWYQRAVRDSRGLVDLVQREQQFLF